MQNFFKEIEKICQKHSTEVLVNPTEPVWTFVIEFFLAIAKVEKIRHKNYVRNWLNSFLYRFIKTIANEIKFDKVLETLLHNRKKIKFLIIKPIVTAILADKMTEVSLYNTAIDKFMQENEQLIKNLKSVSSSGVLFNEIKCDLCKRNVNKTLLAVSDESRGTYFDDKDPLNE